MGAEANPDPWNSLEIAKLLVNILMPITIAAVGWFINRQIKNFEHAQWISQTVIERRIKLFDEMAPLLNDLLCYFTFIGSWKEFSPKDIVSYKRKLDKLAYVNAPLFSPNFLSLYNALISACFETYTGWGNDAKLRTTFQRREKALGSNWDKSCADCFASTNLSDPNEVKKSYFEIMRYFSKEMGITLEQDNVACGRIPSNIN